MSKSIKLKDGRIIPKGVKISLLEEIVYFNDIDLSKIGYGYVSEGLEILNNVPMYTDVRYFLEESVTKRHPIPYALIKYKDEYFLADRLKGGTEARLHGKKGLLGGHVDKLDVVKYGEENKSILFKNSLLRELKEEVGITTDKVDSISFKGYIRVAEKDRVEGVHLALIYVVELNTKDITSEEEEVLKGKWYTKEEIKEVYDTLEYWSELVIKNEVLG